MGIYADGLAYFNLISSQKIDFNHSDKPTILQNDIIHGHD